VDSTRAETQPPELGPGAAHLVAWLLLALVNAVVVEATLEPVRAEAALRHHLLDAGQMVALGLASALGASLAEGWRRRPAMAALFATAAAIDAGILHEDLVPRASKLAGPTLAWLAAMTALFAALVPLAAALGSVARRRPLLRALAVAAGLQLAAMNHLVLQRNYPGVHLQALWIAAVLVGSALTGARAPRLVRLSSSRGVRLGLVAALGALALAGLVLRPPSSVLVRALASPGCALVPFIARAQAWAAARSLRAGASEPARVDMPPTSPPVLPRDAVVVLVTVDSLRADVVADDRYAERLPALRALRNEAQWFTNARTTAPATIVALSSLFSGRYFSQLYWSEYHDDWEVFPHEDPTPRLPELLSSHGVHTVVLHGFEWLVESSGVSGRFAENLYFPPSDASRHFEFAAHLVTATIEKLDAHRDGPLFVFMHWLEPHAPYDVGREESGEFERYLAEIEVVDRDLGRLREALRARFPDRAVLIVSADHGEAFAEHHVRGHGLVVYDEVVRVPLLVSLPGRPARRIAEAVSLIDLGPTLLDLFGATTPAGFEGRSLVPLLAADGAAQSERVVVVDSGRGMRSLVFADGQKVIYDRLRGTVELYDLHADPGERENLVDVLAHDAAARLDVLHAFFASRELQREGYTIPFRPP
jgi:arylsulfatase A-like enzyme